MRQRGDGLWVAETFEEHMDPGLRWVPDEVFAQAFREETTMEPPYQTTESQIIPDNASWTDTSGKPLPAYVNVGINDTLGKVTLIVRPAGGTIPTEMSMPVEAFAQFVVDCQRMLGQVEAAPAETSDA